MKINLTSAVLLSLFPSALMAQTFGDTFDADTSPLYTITQTTDATATFAFDYATLGIPSAPNTPDGSTLGLRMAANVTTGAAHGITLHTVVPFTGDYVVKFDAWINANGPFPGGGGGSTEFLTCGVGGDSTAVNTPGAGSGAWYAATGEGGSSRDYRGYKGGAEQFAESGQWASGNSSAGGGAHNHFHPYFAQFGGIDVGALPQAVTFAQQTGTVATGALGFEWHEIEMRVVSDGGTGGATSVSWSVDGLLFATLDAGVGSSFSTDGAVTLGYMDIFSSVSDNSALSFGLIDNLRIGPPASSSSIGNGCAGAAGVPVMTATTEPALGASCELETTNIDPLLPVAAMVIGFTELPFPVDLQLIGMGLGCEAFINLDILATFPAAAGTGTFALTLPNDLALAGNSLFFQAAPLDSVAPGSFIVSNAIEATLGL